MIVVGVDLSLTSTGLCTITDEPASIHTRLVTSSGKNKDTLTQRFARQTRIVNQILEYLVPELGSAMANEKPVLGDDYHCVPDLCVIEGLFASGQVGGSQIDRFGLWWRVTGSLLLWNIPVVVLAATSAKKFLTGHGKADKGTMVRQAGNLWPDWEPSTASSSEDEADAIALASAGVALLGDRRIELTKYRKEVLAKLQEQMIP